MTHKELMDGPFKQEDFATVFCLPEHSRKEMDVLFLKDVAAFANEKFHKLLGAKVYGRVFTEKDSMGHLHYWHSEPGDKDHDKIAYLIGPFEIESEKEE